MTTWREIRDFAVLMGGLLVIGSVVVWLQFMPTPSLRQDVPGVVRTVNVTAIAEASTLRVIATLRAGTGMPTRADGTMFITVRDHPGGSVLATRQYFVAASVMNVPTHLIDLRPRVASSVRVDATFVDVDGHTLNATTTPRSN